jgi:hypothetical protein
VRTNTLILFFSLVCFAAAAQKPDSLSALKEFISACNAYKQMPLHLSLDYSITANFVTDEKDTLKTSGEFFIKQEGSYIRFGEMEQIVNDSLTLIISDQLQQMILYLNAGQVVSQMKALMGMQVPDSSIANFSKGYTCIVSAKEKEMSLAKVNSRGLLFSTSLPKETIEIEYMSKTKTPLKVTMVKRSLIPISDTDTTAFIAQFGNAGSLIATKDKGYFLIKEQTSTFIYKKIEHDGKIQLPVTMSDRIVRNNSGEYVPTKGFETYRIDQNF